MWRLSRTGDAGELVGLEDGGIFTCSLIDEGYLGGRFERSLACNTIRQLRLLDFIFHCTELY